MTHQTSDWLSLIEISGPFLAEPVLKEVFPQGLEELDPGKRKRLRQTYEEWCDAVESGDELIDALHTAWIDEVLARTLELDEDGKGDVLKRMEWCAAHLATTLIEHGVGIAPDYAVVDEQKDDAPLMFVHRYAPDVDLNDAQKFDGWTATPAERMVALCRAKGCRIGLATNGERWMLVDAPVGAVTSFASWYARLWVQEPVTLQAFVHLLRCGRFFGNDDAKLPALIDRSLRFQDEVTDALGDQVRRAVEVLIQALDKADQDRGRELLRGISEPELYEAALTVMMRLVFLLSAEERGLLLMGDGKYEAHYAISTLRSQLVVEEPEILEKRKDAWSRLLATFRAVFGGIEHENLRLPALGGSLFDPDRFPFLEGRSAGTTWRTDPAKPLPIDNRTVLLLLEAIQQFQGRTLSYRALDVEQIGYVYEGLLERTVKRTANVTLDIGATLKAEKPLVTLAELESAKLDGKDRLVALLRERSGSSESRVRNDLAKPVDDALSERLLTACLGDTELLGRIKPYGHLLRTDPWGYPLVYPKGAFVVTTGSDRRETGTHYTPKSLTEAIVAETLTPIAYVGPAEGLPRAEWRLKSPAELLDLKICDPAMGSGAFLVQACRWLAERLAEAWSRAEDAGQVVSVDGEALPNGATQELLPRDAEERIIIARRLVAERCLYGVDLNPLAVELAKLSIWLVTLAKDRPFGFLDHNLRCGDSLLGIHRLDQITQLSMTPNAQGQLRLFGQNIEQAVREAIELRLHLREMPIRDIRDVEAMAHLDAEARRRLEVPESIADAFIGEVFTSTSNGPALGHKLASLSIRAGEAIEGDQEVFASLRRRASSALATDLPADKAARRPFHWPLEFPEVFALERGGFDAIVGNPPFLGGKRITGVAGTAFRDWLVTHIAEGRRGSADLVAYFFLRAWTLLHDGCSFGLLAVNTIAEGDTRQVGLEAMVGAGAVIYAAYPNEPWPGKAAVVTSRVHVYKGEWRGERSLLGRPAPYISAFLSNREEWSPKLLKANESIAYQGSIVLGMGFVLSQEEARRMLDADPKNVEVIFPYINGDDLNSNSEQRPSRWVINFWDWSEERARQYELPWKWISERVQPERQRRNDRGEYVLRKPLPERWWQYADKRPALYHAIGRGQNFERHPEDWSTQQGRSIALGTARLSKFLTFSQLPNDFVASDQIVVFAVPDVGWQTLLDSAIHHAWAWQYRSTRGVGVVGLRYAQTDLFETFPCPIIDAENRKILLELGERLHLTRKRLCTEISGGLTKLYNLYHEASGNVEELRSLHVEVDRAVAKAYGWGDISLGHGYHEVPYLPENDRVRFTISEPARAEVLRRLSELNRQRYEEEIVRREHAGSNPRVSTRVPRTNRAIDVAATQPSFDFEGATTTINGAMPATSILSFLSTHVGWHAKADILAATGITDGQWNTAIADLIASGKADRQGERRGARYSAKSQKTQTGEASE
ncbi:Eco57I restriction-modification methylase domain-containing protein [Cupriavidus agavae]|uniref:site-specific DNA-methyltransferase (adenine-specific) n=1 Tax=Cupriavidus agavae TaxID=1001822 RepID=A0A4Q7RGP6_9BURK|nr:DNA methyltransferase [Cupriavidus agavae]RZT32364.1 hypothetical protein EV147_4109 [Cupriavidus agavae]